MQGRLPLLASPTRGGGATGILGQQKYDGRLLHARGRPGGGMAIRTVREQLGQKDVRTTHIYTHVINRGGSAVKSPIGGVLSPKDEVG